MVQNKKLLDLIGGNLRKRFEHRVMPIDGTDFLYIPIAKNGCTTLKTWIYQLKHGDVLESAHFGKINEELFWLSTKELLATSSRFLVVLRDPLERIFSCYANKVLLGRTINADDDAFIDGVFRPFHFFNEIFEKKIFSAEMTFDEFVVAIADLPDLLADNHTRSQVTFAPFNENAFLKNSTIVLLSDLEISMREIFDIKLFDRAPLLHRMKSEEVFEREKVTQESISLIQKRYQRDYELLKMLRHKNLFWSR